MFDRFTKNARRVMGLARQEAQRLGHSHIGSEHILLGLTLSKECVALSALRNLDVDPKVTRRTIEDAHKFTSSVVTMGQLPFTPTAKRIVEAAAAEARSLKHRHIGSEHILLGVLAVRAGVGYEVLGGQGLGYADLREEVVELRLEALLSESGRRDDRETQRQDRVQKSGTPHNAPILAHDAERRNH